MKTLDIASILVGIYGAFNDDDDLKSKVNSSQQFPGFYNLQPRHGAQMPYIVSAVISVEPWDCLGEDGATGEHVYYQLSVFSNKWPDPRECLGIVQELTRVYDEKDLEIEGYTTVRNERLGSPIPVPQPEKNIMHALVRYRLFLQKD